MGCCASDVTPPPRSSLQDPHRPSPIKERQTLSLISPFSLPSPRSSVLVQPQMVQSALINVDSVSPAGAFLPLPVTPPPSYATLCLPLPKPATAPPPPYSSQHFELSGVSSKQQTLPPPYTTLLSTPLPSTQLSTQLSTPDRAQVRSVPQTHSARQVQSTLQVQGPSSWSCARCTLINPLVANICAACRHKRTFLDNVVPQSWECVACTLVNASSCATCQACQCPAPSYRTSPMKVPQLLATKHAHTYLH